MQKFIRSILPNILALMTGVPRSRMILGEDFHWRVDSITYNLFRVYELIFWRRDGIRPDRRASISNVHYSYSWENLIATYETIIRETLKGIMPKFEIVYIPQLQLAGLKHMGVQPFRFAIAVDNTGNIEASGTTTATISSFTITGSNVILMVSTCNQASGAGNTTGVTANSVAMTKINEALVLPGLADSTVTFWGKLAPTSGNIVATRTGNADRLTICATSYTGVSQSVAIGSLVIDSGNSVAGASITGTLTTPVANCWTVMGTYVSSGGDTTTAGSGTFKRVTGAEIEDQWDSNGAIATATSTTLNVNTGGAFPYGYVMAAIQPPGASGPANWKTWNTVTVATNLKTLNTNTLANIKTYDTIS